MTIKLEGIIPTVYFLLAGAPSIPSYASHQITQRHRGHEGQTRPTSSLNSSKAASYHGAMGIGETATQERKAKWREKQRRKINRMKKHTRRMKKPGTGRGCLLEYALECPYWPASSRVRTTSSKAIQERTAWP